MPEGAVGRDAQGVAVVTGAGRGIGQETARVLSGAGYTVVLAARTPDAIAAAAEELRAAGGRALAVPTDVVDEGQVVHLMARACADFGQMDVLVNSAGSAAFAPAHELDSEGWNRTLASVLTGTFLCSKHALRHMLPRGSGQIANVLSIAARTAFPDSAAYCAAKWVALGLMKVLQEEVRARGVRVTALIPGATATPFWEQHDTHPDFAEMIAPRHVAETILYVLSQPPDVVTDEMVVMPRRGILRRAADARGADHPRNGREWHARQRTCVYVFSQAVRAGAVRRAALLSAWRCRFQSDAGQLVSRRASPPR